MKKKNVLKTKIVFAAAELTPIAKVGGLADVIGSLPIALKEVGADVVVMLPNHEQIKLPMKKIGTFPVTFAKQPEKYSVFLTKIPQSQVPLYLISNPKYIDKGKVYEGKLKDPVTHKIISKDPNRVKFLFFSAATADFVINQMEGRRLFHCHDWHVAGIPLILKSEGIKNIKVLLSIHNVAMHGKTQKRIFDFLGVDYKKIPSLNKKSQKINLIKQAVLNSNLINTVSPTYAKEMLTKEYGEKLDDVLKKRKKDLYGILNGIDLHHFNPQTDSRIAYKYSHKNLNKKLLNKTDLQKICKFKRDKNIPVMGYVSRLTNQKGPELVVSAVKRLVNKYDFQVALLGTGDPSYEKAFRDLAKKYPRQVAAFTKFDAVLAQKIYAGSDMFLMPSRFEPCGLGQMIAMRYGSVPVVRATGGLKDTVVNYNPQKKTGDGFVFTKYRVKDFQKAIEKALKIYQDHEDWHRLTIKIMKNDFSWTVSAKEYIKLYKKLS